MFLNSAPSKSAPAFRTALSNVEASASDDPGLSLIDGMFAADDARPNAPALWDLDADDSLIVAA